MLNRPQVMTLPAVPVQRVTGDLFDQQRAPVKGAFG